MIKRSQNNPVSYLKDKLHTVLSLGPVLFLSLPLRLCGQKKSRNLRACVIDLGLYPSSTFYSLLATSMLLNLPESQFIYLIQKKKRVWCGGGDKLLV